MLTQNELTSYMLRKPDSAFVVFTHIDGSILSADYWIRRVLAKKYRQPASKMFSHCGIVFVEDGVLWYYHQTYPIFKREKFRWRRYNELIEVDTPTDVNSARVVAKLMLKEEVGYGVGLLLNFVFTMWSWLTVNVVKKGHVCATFIAKAFKDFVIPDYSGTSMYDVDPYLAYKRLRFAGFKRFILDRRT